MKAIKSPTVTALVKASMFTQANLFSDVEQEYNRIREYDEKMKQLQNRAHAPYVPPLY